METSLLVPISYNVGEVTDSASLSCNCNICNFRTYSISSASDSAIGDLSISELTIDAAGVITLNPQAIETIGTH